MVSIFGLCIYLSNASCVTVNGHNDNGHCDKTDINNKVCINGSPLDCYRPVIEY